MLSTCVLAVTSHTVDSEVLMEVQAPLLDYSYRVQIPDSQGVVEINVEM